MAHARTITLSVTIDMETGQLKFEVPSSALYAGGLLWLLTEATRERSLLPSVMPRVPSGSTSEG
jgi:hypothetical protein